MYRIKNATAGPGYTLEVEFQDGLRGTIDLSDRLFGPVFEALRDKALFSKVAVDEFGAIGWPNGADLAPDALHQRLTAANASLMFEAPPRG